MAAADGKHGGSYVVFQLGRRPARHNLNRMRQEPYSGETYE